MWLRLTCAALVLAATACDDRPAAGKGSARVLVIHGEDPEMAAAMARARDTLPQFISALRLPTPAQTDFAIKVGFGDGQDTEYMWLAPVSYDGTHFKGKLDGDPVQVRDLKSGDAVTVEPARVADWMYIEDGRMVGGYTTRLLRDRMTPEQRRQYDESRAFKIE